ncbi:hypothetical protein [Paenibacillus lutrae]|uniref:Uncharacterized protein n=1 Tax=Paenibacillus lutrae TaxID=2078573 RepID=A0A7X3JZS3_9BACL|nr:hypothetical protein [Paenibacillus lutrae]MVP00355.1 hypothetical protein [Paenibacillus lutrae]
MDLLAPFKKVVSKVKELIDRESDEIEKDAKLQKWKKKFDTAKASHNVDLMDEREYLYLGNRAVDKNINSKDLPTKHANNVYNIVFEFIETQVNTQIPQPSVKSMREEFADQAHMIEDSVSNSLKRLDIEDINDANERITPVQGYSIMELAWNPDYKHQRYQGDLELHSRHPKQLIPQPRVYRLQKMDYFFVLSTVTADYVERRYGKDLDREPEQYTENTSLAGTTSVSNNKASANGDGTVTEIVCWYKDEDGDIGKFVWVNETVLEDLPKFFFRRVRRCEECGQISYEDVCESKVDVEGLELECGSQRFKTHIEDKETLYEDKIIGDGTMVPAGTEVPYFIPQMYPIVIRRNVPRNFDFGGQSDVDVIRDQQDAIKKVVTKMEEKVMQSGSIIKMPEDLNVTITNVTYQIIKGTVQQLGAIGSEDLQAEIGQDMAFLDKLYDHAQSTLGITNSFQGKEDNSAKSGIAKQIQVQQASGRLQSKQYNKNAAFKELFELMLYFKLAFYDEPRPYLTKDIDGNDEYKDFDRYKFLMTDDNGELYYNTDFLFSADVGSGLPKDPIFMYNQIKEMLGMGAIDKLQYWTILESLNFPMAKQIKSQIEEQMQQEAMMMQGAEAGQPAPQSPEQILGSLSPEQLEQFKSLPPEEQEAILQQALGGAA